MQKINQAIEGWIMAVGRRFLADFVPAGTGRHRKTGRRLAVA